VGAVEQVERSSEMDHEWTTAIESLNGRQGRRPLHILEMAEGVGFTHRGAGAGIQCRRPTGAHPRTA